MPTATLSTRVDDWLWATLRSGVASVSNRVYEGDTAPSTVTFPYVRYDTISPDERLGLNGTRIMGEYVYVVRAVGKTGNWDALETASDQIHTALHQQTGAVTGIEIIGCICEREFKMPEVTDGVRYRNLGWYVRIWAQPA